MSRDFMLINPSPVRRNIDHRLFERGVTVEDMRNVAGKSYWRLVSARWFDEKEAQGRHHIYIEALDEQGRVLPDVPFIVTWPGQGTAQSTTKTGRGFEAGNFPMSPSRNEFSAKIADGTTSDIVRGIGMGADTPGGFNAGIHTSTLLTFQRAADTAPAWPIPPTYTPLWTVDKVQQEFEALIRFYGHEAMTVVDQEAVLALILRMKHDYDLALSKAQFDAWTHEGMAH
jgi:hypothetical protein